MKDTMNHEHIPDQPIEGDESLQREVTSQDADKPVNTIEVNIVMDHLPISERLRHFNEKNDIHVKGM